MVRRQTPSYDVALLAQDVARSLTAVLAHGLESLSLVHSI